MRFIYRQLIWLFLTFFPIHAWAEDPRSILLFGDSIVAGYGVGLQENLPYKLQQYLRAEGHNIRVINAGISGETTTGGSKRLEQTLKQHKPNIVVIALGGNDVLRATRPDITRKNVEAMLKTMQKYPTITTVLSAVRSPFNFGLIYQRQFEAIYPELAEQYSVPLAPFLLESTFGDPALMQPDAIHPNAKGAEVIAEKLGKFLIKKVLD